MERVSITYEYRSDSKLTDEQAKQKAIEQAKLKAIEEKFGVDVSSIQTSYIKSSAEGTNVATSNTMLSLGGTSSRGIWVETIKQEVLEQRYENGFWIVKVHLEGKVRSKTGESVDIKFAFVNNTHDKISRDVFYDGDDIYMTFSSPVSGSLCVYLLDENQNVACLLPYENNKIGCQNVEANKNYLFFYQSSAEDYMRNATEYTLNTQRSAEQNILFVVFSPNKISKASDRKGGKNWRNEPMPRQLSFVDFQKWLSNNQTADPQMTVRTVPITITRR